MLPLKSCFSCLYGRKVPLDLSPPTDVEDLFRKYSDHDFMEAPHLQRFLDEYQGESKTLQEVETLMNLYVKDKGNPPKFSLKHFFQYLFDEGSNLPIDSKVHHNMDLPLSRYYIFTGHNSYLTGNQLSSDCSEEPIIKALERGVRVIELDLWPNPSKDHIHVKHGGTLTAPVDFEKCIKAIKEHAFVNSDFPVIITFEDHLTAPLQAKAAEIVHRIFGKTLYCPDPHQEGFTDFPSPASLKNKIIISTKPPKEYIVTTQNANFVATSTTEVNSKQSPAVNQEEAWGAELPDSFEDDPSADKTTESLDVYDNDDDDDDDDINAPEVAPEYKRIISIRAGKPRGKSLSDALALEPYVKRVSLSEPELSKVARAHPDVVVNFTKRNLLRVYPKGIRVNSSNYSPLEAWLHGAQMVAFNMQGYGRPLWLVHGFFKANGGIGYVKKPDFLIDQGFRPMDPRPVKQTLKVKIYQGAGWKEKFKKGHFDTFSPPDFYTRVGIAGGNQDSIMKKTETIIDNWTPHWNEEFEFPLRVPELALLRIEVHEYDATDKDDFGGQTCLPVSELKRGIRTIPLYDKKGRELSPVKLLVQFSFIDS